MKSSIATLSLFVSLVPAIPTRRDTSACPLHLPDEQYEFPHLIVPINNSNIAMGHDYFATITPNNSATLFDFDVPSSRANQACSLWLSLPRNDQLVTSHVDFTGINGSDTGSFEIVHFQAGMGATDATTGESQPPLSGEAPIQLADVKLGTAYKIWSGNCGAGGVMSWKLSSQDTSLRYFQDWNPCAIGMWLLYDTITTLPEPCGMCPDNKKFSSHAAWMQSYIDSFDRGL